MRGGSRASGGIRAALCAGLLLGTPAAVAAAQEGGSQIFSLNLGLVIWTWVLFLLTLAILAWKVFPAIAGGLEQRQRKIQEAIDAARQDREEARRLLDEHARQLAEARREAQGILRESRVAGDKLREEILARARAEHAELLDRARRELSRERDELMQSVRREAVEISLAAAERLIRQRVDDEASRRLVQEYVAELR
ncbi:MAG: F0F1 ATP synthase subunit B [Gemmatimonadota bacterium]